MTEPAVAGPVTGQEAGCHICGQRRLQLLERFSRLQQVTSDCRPWARGGRLAVCHACGVLQKVVDERYRADVAAIYQGYVIYHLGEGAEQLWFDQATGRSLPRSERILRWLMQRFEFPGVGRLLDVGCGNGGLLRSAHRLLPGWTLAGTELDERNRAAVEAIPGCEGLYTRGLDEIPGAFDLVSLNNVVEHFIGPQEVLASLRERTVLGGRLLVETGNHRRNPFDLLIADHVSHFSPATLARLLESEGFAVLGAWDECIPKELTLFAERRPATVCPTQPPQDTIAAAEAAVSWLLATAAAARAVAASGPVGIFGTAIAGGWLFAELEGKAAFFVEEDPQKVGKAWFGLPVLAPAAVAPGTPVLLPFPSPVARRIRERFARDCPGLDLREPPDGGR